MLLKTSGLVIREKVLSNDNRMLTILTGEYGVIKAFIRTSRKMRSSLAAAIDLFSYSDFLIFFNKDQYCVDGAETNRIFYHLREDLEKTSLAAYMGELAETLVPQGEPAQEYLSLMLNCLHLLETDQRTVDFIKQDICPTWWGAPAAGSIRRSSSTFHTILASCFVQTAVSKKNRRGMSH